MVVPLLTKKIVKKRLKKFKRPWSDRLVSVKVRVLCGKAKEILMNESNVQIKAFEAVICVAASQIANLGESVIGAALQEKEGFRWLNNDAVNVINITMGSIVAVLLQQIVLQNWVA